MATKENKNENKNNIIQIDATDKQLGRLSSQIAYYLQGKHLPSYQPHLLSNVTVIVNNLSKAKISSKKMENKIYYRHTGYIGHLKQIKLKDLWAKDPKSVLKMMVRKMLPKNKLRDKRLKRLIINL